MPHEVNDCTCGPPNWWDTKDRTHYGGCPLAEDWQRESKSWTWDWFDESPRGETYGVRRAGEVICYTNRYAKGYEDAVVIAAALNAGTA